MSEAGDTAGFNDNPHELGQFNNAEAAEAGDVEDTLNLVPDAEYGEGSEIDDDPDTDEGLGLPPAPETHDTKHEPTPILDAVFSKQPIPSLLTPDEAVLRAAADIVNTEGQRAKDDDGQLAAFDQTNDDPYKPELPHIPLDEADEPNYTGEFMKMCWELDDARLSIEAAVQEAQVRADADIEAYRQKFGLVPSDTAVFTSGAQTLRAQADELGKIISFLRTPSDGDIGYRHRIRRQFAAEIQHSIPDGLPLRFASMPLWQAEDALTAGVITSPPTITDRVIGYSHPMLSVSTPGQLQEDIDSGLCLMQYNYCAPPGCTFAVLPRWLEEASLEQSVTPIHTATEPRRVVAIATAPQDKGRVQEWAAAAGLPPTVVTGFFELANVLGYIKQAVSNGSVSLADAIPYLNDKRW